MPDANPPTAPSSLAWSQPASSGADSATARAAAMAAAAAGVRQASVGLDGAHPFEGAGGGEGGREGGEGGGALLRTSSVAGPASFTLYHYNGLSTGKKSSVAGLPPTVLPSGVPRITS